MKKALSFILIPLWISAVAFSYYLLTKNDEQDFNDNAAIVIEIWQIDMVEGGKGSRRQYLKSVADKFEKQNKNVIVSVASQTAESAEKNFSKGVYPDMISYSTGLSGVLPALAELNVSSVNMYGGTINNKKYALPWALGGYVYLEHENAEGAGTVYLSKTDYNLPAVALFLEGYDCKNVKELSPEDAFSAFLNDKASALVGTQRDLYRMQPKNLTFKVTYFSAYTDIVQYISVVKKDESRRKLCNKYLEFLIADKENLPSKIGMMAIGGNAKSVENRPIEGLFDVNYTFTLPIYYGKNEIDELNNTIRDEKIESDKKKKYIKSAIIRLK